ncbi:MAG: hypothetical protein KA198_08455 [Chitinophagaceae bacterium]|nr:hypothetical protein [Chitinophagaceae bacterium]
MNFIKKYALHLLAALCLLLLLLQYLSQRSSSTIAIEPVPKEVTTQQSSPASEANPSSASAKPSQSSIPKAAFDMWNYVKKNHRAPKGYVGGREFKNRERILKQKNQYGKYIRYQEWDIYPKQQGRNRGAERLVTGNDESAWYTGDHYKTFQSLLN